MYNTFGCMGVEFTVLLVVWVPNVQYFWRYWCSSPHFLIILTHAGYLSHLQAAILLSCSHAQSRVVDEDVASTFYSLSTTTVYEPL